MHRFLSNLDTISHIKKKEKAWVNSAAAPLMFCYSEQIKVFLGDY